MVYPLQEKAGRPPTVTDRDENIQDILIDFKINDGPFKMEEFRKVKTSLKQGKSAGPDGIPPIVLKNCELSDIMLAVLQHSANDE